MDYNRIYHDFIVSRQDKVVSGERHHIVPRALGGGDEDTNLIVLTPGDHLFAHMLLAKIHGGSMLHAVALMLNDGKYRGRVSRTWFAKVRDDWRATCGQHAKGRPQGTEHLRRRSEAMLGNKNTTGYKQSAEHIAARIRPAGWRHSEETREKQRIIALTRRANKN